MLCPEIGGGLGAFQICIAGNRNVFKEIWQLIERQRLRTINQRLWRIRVKIGQHHIGANDHRLGGYVKCIEYSLRRHCARSDRVARVDTNRHPGQAFDDRYVREIDKIAMRVTEIRLHSAQRKNDLAVAFAGQILGSVERLVQRDSEASLDQHRIRRLPFRSLA